MLKPGDGVNYGDVLSTSKNKEASINFHNNITSVDLQKNTKIKVKKKNPNSKKWGIFLFAGRVWNLFKSKKKNGYYVETFNSVAAVEGTEFEVAFDSASGTTSLSVEEGVVNFSCKTSAEPPIKVRAGSSASIDNACNITSQNHVNNTITSTNGMKIYPIADSHVYAYSYSGWNKANWGKYNILGAGWNPTGCEKRAYLKFDVSRIDKATFKKATLKLYHYHTAGSNSAELGVYTVRSPWNEGSGNYKPANIAAHGEVCWINQPQSDQYPVAYFNPGMQTNDFVEVDITPLVKSWLEGMANHGMAIKTGESYLNGPVSVYGFYSREYKDAKKRPQIVLNGGLSVIQEPQVGQNTNVIINSENGRPWVIGQYNGIHYCTGSGWKQQSGGGKGKDIAIDGNDRPWVIGSDNGIYYHNGNKWVAYPGGGRGYALAVTPDGTPWVIGTNNHIYYGSSSGWIEQPGNGKGKDIAIDNQGRPWVIGMNNGIFYYEGRWIEYPGGGRGSKLAISPNGSPWVVGSDNDIFYHDGNRWVRQAGGKIIAKDIAVDDQNRPWVLKSDNRIFFHNGSAWVEYPGRGRGLAIAISTNNKAKSFSSTSGHWNLNQSNGYSGSMNIQQTKSGRITGNAIWNGNLKGTINGYVYGNLIEFTISYTDGVKGFYKGTITSNKTRIVNGTSKASNGTAANWDASR